MSNGTPTSDVSRRAGQYYIHASILPGLRSAIVRCADIVYDPSWRPGAATACVFTSIVLAASLRRMGFDARPVAVTVEGACPGGRFAIGHPAYRLIRPGAWKGHLVCMVEDVLIDATISHVRRLVGTVPLLIAARSGRAWAPEIEVALTDCVLRWSARGANQTWPRLPDAMPSVWQPAVECLLRRLGSNIPRQDAAE